MPEPRLEMVQLLDVGTRFRLKGESEVHTLEGIRGERRPGNPRIYVKTREGRTLRCLTRTEVELVDD